MATPARAMPTADASPVGRALAAIYRDWRGSVVQVISYRSALGGGRVTDSDGSLMRIEPARSTLWASGVVLDGEGHVLTCAESAQPGDSLELGLADGSRVGARFVAQDVTLGLSLVRANDSYGLIPIRLASSDCCQIGDWMLVMSYPAEADEPELRLGSFGTSLNDPTGTYFPLSLSDCHGACGGVVLDASGRLQGMVVDVRTDRDADLPTGRDPQLLDPLECQWVRALRSGQLPRISADLEARSRTPAGFLGVRAEAETTSVGPRRPRRDPEPLLRVVWVLPGSPAEAVGIRPGDQILALDDLPVGQVSQIVDKVCSSPPGTTLRVRLLRDGVPLDVTPRLVDRSALEWQERERQLNLLRQKRVKISIEQLQRRLRTLEQERSRLQ
jgi:S1-C subfamily serine protease